MKSKDLREVTAAKAAEIRHARTGSDGRSQHARKFFEQVVLPYKGGSASSGRTARTKKATAASTRQPSALRYADVSMALSHHRSMCTDTAAARGILVVRHQLT